tara:strand:+ start:903 stop:1388 length:486 start_codon:yes stop_codon:yes gene_type:complete
MRIKKSILVIIILFLGVELRCQDVNDLKEGNSLFLVVIVEKNIKLLHYEYFLQLEDTLISFPDIESSPAFIKNPELEDLVALDELHKRIFNFVQDDNCDRINLDNHRECQIFKFEVSFFYRIENGLNNTATQLVVYDANYKRLKRVNVDSIGLVQILNRIM